jgi:hypothetical protein
MRYCIKALRSVPRNSNLQNPESTKTYLAHANLTESRKTKLTEDLTRYYHYKHIPFHKPNYHRIEKLPFIPLETEIDQLIAGVGKKTATFLHGYRERTENPYRNTST